MDWDGTVLWIQSDAARQQGHTFNNGDRLKDEDKGKKPNILQNTQTGRTRSLIFHPSVNQTAPAKQASAPIHTLQLRARWLPAHLSATEMRGVRTTDTESRLPYAEVHGHVGLGSVPGLATDDMAHRVASSCATKKAWNMPRSAAVCLGRATGKLRAAGLPLLA